jgi:hypothetical protein
MRTCFTRLNDLFRVLSVSIIWLTASHLLAQNATISGKVVSVTGAGCEQVPIIISGSVNTVVMTDFDGNYHITVPIGGAYAVTPYCGSEEGCILNGVTTYDIVLLKKHALGVSQLQSPYAYIAADADNNGLVDLNDTLPIRDAILGQTINFPNNKSVRFVRADYVFPNPGNPFQPPYPEFIGISNLTSSISNVDFIAVKIGDVNNSWIPGLCNSGSGLNSSRIYGSVKQDINTNCVPGSAEPGLAAWQITAVSQYNTFYGLTNTNGNYSICVPLGTYDVVLTRPNQLWSICNDTIHGLQLSGMDSVQADFAVQSVGNCPFMYVDLSSHNLRRCRNNDLKVLYANQGTVVANDVRVEVELDTLVTLNGSSLPWTAVSGNTYTFPIGQIEPGQGGSFTLHTFLSCNATAGQTICSTAHIYPDTVCSLLDSLTGGPELLVKGHCQNGSVVFTITNSGADMTSPASYVVIEDIMIQMTGTALQLAHGQTEVLTFPANGSTWRVEVNQAQGNSWNSPAVGFLEGCGTNPSGNASVGFINEFPLGDQSPFIDVDCHQVVSSFDPNEKSAAPRGVSSAHWLKQDQEIEYYIEFQNTGNDTAFSVMVLDTLSDLLDLTTLRPLGSSNPYSLQMIGAGVLQFVFTQLMLPDSNVNEPASHGYVKFAIKPKKDAPNGAVLNNKASIYFDFNTPVITNTVFHTLGAPLLQVSTANSRSGISLEVFPNPVSRKAVFYIKSGLESRGFLRIYDSMGRLVTTQAFNRNRFEFNASTLPSGAYFFRLDAEDGLIGSGRLVVLTD